MANLVPSTVGELVPTSVVTSIGNLLPASWKWQAHTAREKREDGLQADAARLQLRHAQKHSFQNCLVKHRKTPNPNVFFIIITLNLVCLKLFSEAPQNSKP
eukprot:GHVT01067498.1.p3 GENE.GHVT01067498.1~~GHVT01067498.1.p3  ORF type:complete len:101 (-),score=5.71 GHVT01067498.1:1737-2039(-)